MTDNLIKNELWLSVCVPVFNVQDYLSECLTSMVDQLEDGMEIVLLDDCSTDQSSVIAQEFVNKYPAVFRLHKNERNLGLSGTRNRLMDLARGDYIWFVDSDDALHNGAFDKLKKTVKAFNPDMVICDFRIWRAKDRLKYKLRGEMHRKTFPGSGGLISGSAAILKGFFTTGQMHAWTKIIKREIWLKTPKFPVGKAFEDMALMPRASLLCGNAVYVPEVWISYRQRPGSIISTMNQQKLMDLSSALTDFKNDLFNLDQVKRIKIENNISFEMTHICARNMITVLKVLSKQNKENKSEVIAEVRANFGRQSLLSYGQFLMAYVKRGWFARCVRFVYFYKNLG